MYIPVDAVSKVSERVARYNKKWGTNVSVSFGEPEVIEVVSDRRWKSVEAIKATLDAPQVRTAKEGVELLEIVSVKDGVEHVTFKGTEEYIPYRKNECDHCHSKRARKLYFIIRYQGEVKQIGSGCISEYLGENVYSVFSGFYKLVEDLEEEAEERISLATPLYTSEELVKALYEVTKGFTKWESAKYGFGTSEQVRVLLAEGTPKSSYTLSAEDKEEIAKHVLYNKNNKGGEFTYNIASAVLDNNGNFREMVPFRAIGTYCYGIYDYFKSKKEGKIEQEKRKGFTPVSAEIGKTISFVADVTFVRRGESDFGTYYEYMASDGEHCAIWKTSRFIENCKARVTGKVRGLWNRKQDLCTQLGGKVKVETI